MVYRSALDTIRYRYSSTENVFVKKIGMVNIVRFRLPINATNVVSTNSVDAYARVFILAVNANTLIDANKAG